MKNIVLIERHLLLESTKFWECTILTTAKNVVMIRRWGKKDALFDKGQFKVESIFSIESAHETINSKLKKGYRYCSDGITHSEILPEDNISADTITVSKNDSVIKDMFKQVFEILGDDWGSVNRETIDALDLRKLVEETDRSAQYGDKWGAYA